MLRWSDLKLAHLDSILDSLRSSLSSLSFNISFTLRLFLIVLISVFSFCNLPVLGTEVDQLLTKINLKLIWVLFELRQLLSFPCSAPLLLFLFSLFLPCLVLSTLTIPHLSHPLPGFPALALLLLILLGASMPLHHSLLCFFHPFNIFNEALLNLEVAHFSIELFPELVFLFFETALFFLHLFNFDAFIG